MSLGEHDPVDPLSEPRWGAIRERVFAEVDAEQGTKASVRPARSRARPWVGVAAFAAAAVAVAVVVVALQSEPQRGSLESTRIATEEATTHAVLGDVSVEAEPRTSLVAVESDTGGWLVVLERGAATFAVPHREGRPPFVIESGGMSVEVVGTRFRVERTLASTSVETFEGIVRVTSRGEIRLVRRGERWSSTPPSRTAATEPVALSAAYEPSGGEPQHEEPTPASTSARDRRAEFERAASYEASDPDRAIRLYRQLLPRGDTWSANALYAVARLELERGRDAVAARELRRYLARFPRGVNADDAARLLARIERHESTGEEP
jgi:hypothetical protein